MLAGASLLPSLSAKFWVNCNRCSGTMLR
jgi:hypothetical protein